MTGGDVQQSLRRLTAILLIPLSMLLIEVGIHLREQHGIVLGWKSQVIAEVQVLGGGLVLGAIGYLVLSVIGGVSAVSE